MGKGQGGSAEWEFLTEKLLYAGIFLVVAGSLLFIDIPQHGRLWDQLTRSSSTTDEEPLLAAQEPADSSQDDGRDRLLVSAPQEPRPAATKAAPASYPRLTSQLIHMNDFRRRPAQKTSASLAGEPNTPEPSAAAWTPMAAYSLEAPAEEENGSRRSVVSGRARASGRNAIMSRSAGPVYNVTAP